MYIFTTSSLSRARARSRLCPPVCSCCAQSPARPALAQPRQHPGLHRFPPGSASVTAGTARKATASAARGSSQLAPWPPPDPSARLLPTADKARGREGKKRKAREKGAGGGDASCRGGKRQLSGGRCCQRPALLRGCSQEAALLRALNTHRRAGRLARPLRFSNPLP